MMQRENTVMTGSNTNDNFSIDVQEVYPWSVHF